MIKKKETHVIYDMLKDLLLSVLHSRSVDNAGVLNWSLEIKYFQSFFLIIQEIIFISVPYICIIYETVTFSNRFQLCEVNCLTKIFGINHLILNYWSYYPGSNHKRFLKLFSFPHSVSLHQVENNTTQRNMYHPSQDLETTL